MHILEPNGRPLNDERLHHVPLIFQIYHDNSMHILDSSQRLQWFISEIVHTEDSFLLKLYYKFNFATEPKSK